MTRKPEKNPDGSHARRPALGVPLEEAPGAGTEVRQARSDSKTVVLVDGFSFPPAQLERRMVGIREKMKGGKLDALIVTRGENIFYGRGFRASHFASWRPELHALVIPLSGAPRLMTRALERAAARLQ